MRYLVTGGAGFIGSNFVRQLLQGNRKEAQIEVIVLDNFGIGSNTENLVTFKDDPRLHVIAGDITNEETVKSVMKRIDVVLNFAAESHVDRSLTNPSSFIQSNIVGTEVLLRTAVDNGISRFIQISTDEVYGSIESGESIETDPLLPNSPYSASKASADLIVRSYVESFGFNASITRCCNNFGPYQFPEKMIPLFVTNLLEGKKVPLYGNGKNIREWIYVEDHCKGIEAVIHNGSKGEIYNIGTSNRISNLDLTLLILSIMNLSPDMIEYVEDRKGHDLRYALNSQKLNKNLGVKFESNFQEKIIETIEWYKKRIDWWSPLLRTEEDLKKRIVRN